MSSRADSHARTSAWPGQAPDLPASVQDSTGNWFEPFAWYDRATRSWRTWQRCLVEGWTSFLAEIGYDAEWHCIPASAVGAPHRRDRVWIVADSNSGAWQSTTFRGERPTCGNSGPQDSREVVPDADGDALRPEQEPLAGCLGTALAGANGAAGHVADAERVRQLQPEGRVETLGGRIGDGCCEVADAESFGRREGATDSGRCREGARTHQWPGPAGCGWWFSEPDVGRVAHGVPARVDRLRSLGNAIVPQIAELIGRAINAARLA